ncbi:MAG: hypothetical protein HKN04_12305 [Rhodothermaceae bacterium]|nr:hypothetical protein [Rhodothermaceae bacterium]
MLKNYLTITLRHLRRHRLSASINIGGLAVGLACCLVILLFVRHELSYDTFHGHDARLYRLTYQETGSPSARHLATTAPPTGPAIREQYPEIEASTRLRDVGGERHLVSHGDRQFYESAFFYADTSFFRLFSFPLRQGDPATALAAPNSIVLTPATARKYFGDDDPMGQALRFDDEILTVTGVLADPPGPSHLEFDFLVSFSTFRVPFGYPVTLDSWVWKSFHTYVLLREGTDPATLEPRLTEFVRRSSGEERAQTAHLRLQPVSDIYLGEPHHTAIATGNRMYVVGLSGVAFLILLLACFNFMNLSTAHAIERVREVSVRKALGAAGGDLRRQFLTEATVTVWLALGVAVGLTALLLSGLTAWLGWSLAVTPADMLVAGASAAAGATLLGLLAGAYPAFVLAALQPATVLKGQVGILFSGSQLRRTLVVLQFTIAIALIAASFVVARQMNMIQTRALGFEQESVVAMHVRGDVLLENYDVLRERLLQNVNVAGVSQSGHLFDGDNGSVPIFPDGSAETVGPMNLFGVHYDFYETMGLRTAQGRVHDRAFASDSAEAIVINETAARLLAASVPGWEAPIGRRLRIDALVDGRVIGVIEDFHYASLHREIGPLVLFIPPTHLDHVTVRLRPGNVSTTLASLERDWQAVVPGLPFDYTFLDSHLQRFYESDARFARLMSFFTVLTILIACFGLYGLVALATRARTKEIGVRKVLGASRLRLVTLLSGRFLLYVALANVLAWPLAFLAAERWLDGFAYRIDIGFVPFLVAGALVFAVSLLTVGGHTLRAATTDPVKALRYE